MKQNQSLEHVILNLLTLALSLILTQGCTLETIRVSKKTASLQEYTHVAEKDDTVYLGLKVKKSWRDTKVIDIWTTMKLSEIKPGTEGKPDRVSYSEPKWEELPQDIVESAKSISIRQEDRKVTRAQVEKITSREYAALIRSKYGNQYYLVYYSTKTGKPARIHCLHNPRVSWTDYITLSNVPIALVFDVIFSPFYLIAELSK